MAYTAPNGESVKDEFDHPKMLIWLDTIRRDFDPVLLAARKQWPPSGWLGAWFVRSLLGMKYKKLPDDSVSKVQAFFTTPLLVWFGWAFGVGGTAINQLFSQVGWENLITIGVLVFCLGMSLYNNLSRMLTLNDPYFNPAAYKLFRPKEYLMIVSYLQATTGESFGTIYDWVRVVYDGTQLREISHAYQRTNDELRRQIEEFRQTNERLEADLAEADSDFQALNNKLNQLHRQVVVNEKGFNDAVDVIYRLRSTGRSLFDMKDLRVLTSFSLFEVVGDDLYMLGEQGTTETPAHINIHDPEFSHYSSVKLINSSEPLEYATSDREGRTVASYWIELPSGRLLIYNFHFDSTSIELHDIIESKEMYRLIRGICIHLDERGLLRREGEEYGKTTES